MSKEEPPIRRLIIMIIPKPVGGGDSSIVESENFAGKKFSVESECERIEASRGDDETKGVDLLIGVEDTRNNAEGDGPNERESTPQKDDDLRFRLIFRHRFLSR